MLSWIVDIKPKSPCVVDVLDAIQKPRCAAEIDENGAESDEDGLKRTNQAALMCCSFYRVLILRGTLVELEILRGLDGP